MKIEHSTGKPIATPSGERVQGNSTKSPDSVKAPAGDKVKLTSSSQLQALSNAAGEDSPIDSVKVEAIKQAITEGRFKIDPEKIADRLLNSVKETLAHQRA